MNTTPASTKTTRARRAGPRSSYQAEYAEQARKLCLLLGADDQELARFFDVPPATLQEWLASVPEFAAAVLAGRALADADVADRLWRRAIGYSHAAVRIFSHQGKALEVAYTEHYPPDTAACLFWLKSRQPEQWRDRIEHEHHAVAGDAGVAGRRRREGEEMLAAADLDKRLHGEIGALRFDPLGYVMYAFPWGMPGTALADEQGPEPWQRDILERLGEGLISTEEAVRAAVASGHGVGKSALVSWIVLWALSTVRDTRGVVTANTEGQLRTKTWPELAKWYGLCLNRSWFTYSATALASTLPGHEKTWRVDAITWSENNTEAIAGLHNKGRRAFAVFDEASAIPDGIWETIEGALTDARHRALLVRVRQSDAQHRPLPRMLRRRPLRPSLAAAQQVDSRSVSMTNKAQIAEWVKDYGEDSDFVRVRVRGVFPRAGDLQFIDGERVDAGDAPASWRAIRTRR